MVKRFELDPEELEEAHAKARRKIIAAAAMGNNAGMQAYAIMLLADAVMMQTSISVDGVSAPVFDVAGALGIGSKTQPEP